MNCSMHRGVKLLEHAMKIVEKTLDKILRNVVTIDDIKFGTIPVIGTIDAVFTSRRIHEEYLAKQQRLHVSFVDMEKAFDRVPKKNRNGQ